MLRKRLTVRGFIVSDFAASRRVPRATWAPGCAEGRVKYREDVIDGLEKAPGEFIGLLQGENFGKKLVRVAK